MILKTRKRLKKLVLPKFSLADQKNLRCPKFGGGAAAPPAPRPVRLCVLLIGCLGINIENN